MKERIWEGVAFLPAVAGAGRASIGIPTSAQLALRVISFRISGTLAVLSITSAVLSSATQCCFSCPELACFSTAVLSFLPHHGYVVRYGS